MRFMSTDLSNTGSFSYRPDQIANPKDFSFNTTSQAQDYGCSNPGHQTLDCWVNQAAFVAPPLAPGQQSAHSFGNAKIGDLRGPNLVDFDLVLQKNFKIRESQQIEFRSEFFNLFNHPNFGLPGGGSSVYCRCAGRRRDHEHGDRQPPDRVRIEVHVLDSEGDSSTDGIAFDSGGRQHRLAQMAKKKRKVNDAIQSESECYGHHSRRRQGMWAFGNRRVHGVEPCSLGELYPGNNQAAHYPCCGRPGLRPNPFARALRSRSQPYHRRDGAGYRRSVLRPDSARNRKQFFTVELSSIPGGYPEQPLTLQEIPQCSYGAARRRADHSRQLALL